MYIFYTVNIRADEMRHYARACVYVRDVLCPPFLLRERLAVGKTIVSILYM